MQWLSLDQSYLSSFGQDLLLLKPDAYTLQTIVCKLKVFAETTRENNSTLCNFLVLVFFMVYIAMVLNLSSAWKWHICPHTLHFCQGPARKPLKVFAVQFTSDRTYIYIARKPAQESVVFGFGLALGLIYLHIIFFFGNFSNDFNTISNFVL